MRGIKTRSTIQMVSPRSCYLDSSSMSSVFASLARAVTAWWWAVAEPNPCCNFSGRPLISFWRLALSF